MDIGSDRFGAILGIGSPTGGEPGTRRRVAVGVAPPGLAGEAVAGGAAPVVVRAGGPGMIGVAPVPDAVRAAEDVLEGGDGVPTRSVPEPRVQETSGQETSAAAATTAAGPVSR